MIELFSTETKPVYIGYNKLAADVAEATTDALTGADYIALQATIKYLWFMVIVLSIFALVDRHSRSKGTGKVLSEVGELTEMPTDDIEVEQSREDYGPMVLSLVALPAMLLAASGMLYLILSLLGAFGN